MSSQVSVVGQIQTETVPESVSYVPVALKSGTATIAETVSNQFGEFQMECKQRKNLKLCIYLDHETQVIEVPLQSFGNDTGGERN